MKVSGVSPILLPKLGIVVFYFWRVEVGGVETLYYKCS
jgi:hypothetical protein